MEMIKFGILTVSDRCSQGLTVNLSGSNLKEKVNGIVVREECVPDDLNKIEEILLLWSREDSGVDIILTTGGTGFGVRDVTPEATRRVICRETPAIMVAATLSSLNITPLAMLARGVSGIRNKTLIINLPGSVKGSEECLNAVTPCFKHAVELLRDKVKFIETTHTLLQNPELSKVAPDNLASRQRTSPWKLLSVNESIKLVMNNLMPKKVQMVTLNEALGRVVANNIVANDPLPPFRASIKDGYAVRSQDGPGIYKVLAGYSAGIDCENIQLTSKTCVRVNTGSMVPSSSDAVVEVEGTKLHTCEGDNEVEINILVSVKPGQDIRDIGCDIMNGETVLVEGDPITSTEMGLLATVGVTEVPVYKMPVVSVLSTGNELLQPDLPLVKGKIRDCNKTTILSLLKENGIIGHDLGVAKDEPTELMRYLKKGLAMSDVIITTGSVSMGDKDYLKSVLQQDFGADIHFGRVNMKPGKPTTFATCQFNGQKKLLFCLPGNPVSASVTCHLYVLPAVKTISGISHPFATEIIAMSESELILDPRPEFKRGTLCWDGIGDMPKVVTTGNQMSSRLLSWRHANCLLKLPSSNDAGPKLPANSLVTVLIVSKI